MGLTKEDIDKVQDIEGFPIAKDKDIIALSQPPYYTACPNPFIEDFIREHGKPYDEETDTYHREPYAADVEEDKHDPIYNIHSYHTKVPPRAIMKYIMHYTDPGDIVFDGFCGSGMTGVAAQLCEMVELDGDIDNKYKVGARKPIIADISTVASFISANYNNPIQVNGNIINEIEKIIDNIVDKYGKYYCTNHVIDNKVQYGIDNKIIKGKINYIVWSDIFICPNCSTEIIFYDCAVDKKTNKTLKSFNCNKCNAELTKPTMDRVFMYDYDPILKKNVTVSKKVPVLINYSIDKKRYFKVPDNDDLEIIRELKEIEIDSFVPDAKFENGDKTGELIRAGVEYVKQIYIQRSLFFISNFHKYFYNDNKKMFLLTSALPKLTVLNRYMPEHGSRALVGPMAGTYYVPALSVENNVIDQLAFQLKKLKNLRYTEAPHIITNQSSGDLSNIPEDTIDYIFVDPPFGANIMYSELNFVTESWLKCRTNNKDEAIVNKTQRKDLLSYKELIQKSFNEMYRVLKPKRWITIEFHNSKNTVWNVIQETLAMAGFIVADVRTLDKAKKTINQFNAYGAVNQDLIISAYKPRKTFKRRFIEHSGSEEGAWEFIRQHLSQLPKVVESKGKLEIISERQSYLLFDRMVAYHVMNGIPVPMDASDFYKGLKDRFIERDSMYFLPDQVNEYDDKRIKMDVENVQLSLIVTDEKSAIQWLYGQLTSPMTYQEIQPLFIQNLHQLKYEKMPELGELLEENFLQDYDGKWYIPDINKASDLTKLREKRLVKEFEDYTRSTGKLKVFRMEAIRAGFDKCWKQREFSTIVKVGKRLPESVIQEDSAILMYYDNALSRVE